MKKVLILILCSFPLFLIGQSYDRLSFTHKTTGKNHIIKSGDRLILKGVNPNGKKFSRNGSVLRIEKEFIVFKDQFSYVQKEGQYTRISEINQIKIVDRTKQTFLVIISILISLLLFVGTSFLLFSLAYAGSISLTTSYILGFVMITGIIFLGSFIINSGYDKIKNLQTEWTMEHIILP